MRPADAEGLLALQGIEDRRARVLLGPHTGEAARAFGARVEEAADEVATHARLDGAVGERMTPEEVVLAVRHRGVVRIGCGPEAELVGIEALAILHREAVLERLPRIASHDVRDAPGRIAEQDRHDLEVRELVVRRQEWMRLGRSLQLLD